MRKTKSMEFPLTALVCLFFAGLALAFGTMFAGANTAFAQRDETGSADDPAGTVAHGLVASGGIIAQDAAEQNYAVFDSSTNTLTFYYGPKPEPTATQTIYEGYDTATAPYEGDGDRPWYPKKSSIYHVVFDATVSGHLKPKHTAWWFGQFYSLEDVTGLDQLDLSDCTSMSHMFDNCKNSLTALDLSVLDTSHVTNMAGLLTGCSKLTNLTLGGTFTTENVTAMGSMFCDCSSLASLDVSGFDTSKALTMANMFSGCKNLAELDLSNFNTANVENMAYMFSGCSGFTDCGTKLKLGSGFNTSKVTDMEGMFQGCSNLATISLPTGFSTSNVETMKRMFYGCSALADPSVNGFDTAKVATFYQMFEGCANMVQLDLSHFDTANAQDFFCMFLGCKKLESIVLGNGFKAMSANALDRTFEDCTALQALPDLSNLITSNVTRLNRTFYGCTGLESVDVSGLDLANVENMEAIFQGCTGLTSVRFGNLASGKLWNMKSLFSGCSKLVSVQFGTLTTASSCSMDNLFQNCNSLQNLSLTSWNTSKVTSMNNLFSGCSKLETLNLSSWNTASVNNFNNTFANCSKLCSVTLGEDFSFGGTNSMEWTSYWALLNEPSKTAPYNGLWWKGEGTTSYTRYTMRYLDASDIAGTWTWSEGIAVTPTVSPSQSGIVTVSPVNTGVEGGTCMLTATPVAGYEFSGWELTSGENTGALGSTTANPTTFTFGSANGAVKATFEAVPFAYTIGALSATSFTYRGAEQVPAVAVTDQASGTVLTAGTHYTLSYEMDGSSVASPTDAGTYTVYVTGAGDYAGMPKESAGTFEINPASIAGKALVLSNSAFTYNGNVQKPTVKTVGGEALKAEADYTVAYSNASSQAAGSYTVTVAGKGNYTGTSAKATYEIAKAANPITIAKKTVSVKYAKLKKAKRGFAINRAKKAQGTVSYSITKAVKGKKNFKAKFSMNKATGKITVAKGLAKGTYKVTVKAQAAGNNNYKAGYRTTVITLKVK